MLLGEYVGRWEKSVLVEGRLLEEGM